jgi:ribA/ribD-fused uncharacterized protein
MTVIATPQSVADLLAAETAGQRLKYLFFWGHTAKDPDVVGAECLSQWWPAAFTVDGLGFATAEHYMMWRKALMFGDTAIAERILVAGHPREAKELGRQVGGFDQAVWEAERFGVVTDASVAKFGQNGALRGFLLGTGARVLVEASPRDRIWGIGMSAGHDDAARPTGWRGLNLLGFALMRARDLLRAEAEVESGAEADSGA